MSKELGSWVPLGLHRGWGDIELTAGFVLQELHGVGAKTCVETGVLSRRDYKFIKSYLFQHGGEDVSLRGDTHFLTWRP